MWDVGLPNNNKRMLVTPTNLSYTYIYIYIAISIDLKLRFGSRAT